MLGRNSFISILFYGLVVLVTLPSASYSFDLFDDIRKGITGIMGGTTPNIAAPSPSSSGNGNAIGGLSGSGSSGNFGVGTGNSNASVGVGSGATSGNPRASRIFAGPSQYPPADFGAYAILAFQSKAAPQDAVRHLAICEAYRTTVPHYSELEIPLSQQLVTAWPIASDEVAERINEASSSTTCVLAIESYGLVMSRRAITHAEIAGLDIGVKRGPFLLAWSPTSKKGREDAIILFTDLSGVNSLEEAKRVFRHWVRDIEEDPELWNDDGWSVEKVRQVIANWANSMGGKILFLVKKA